MLGDGRTAAAAAAAAAESASSLAFQYFFSA
jgi:hypothetical protein